MKNGDRLKRLNKIIVVEIDYSYKLSLQCFILFVYACFQNVKQIQKTIYTTPGQGLYPDWSAEDQMNFLWT